MFFQPKYYKITDEIGLNISQDVQVCGDVCEETVSIVKEKLKSCGNGEISCFCVNIINEIPQKYIKECSELMRRDAFVVEVGKITNIYSNSIAGIMYGASFIREHGKNLKPMVAYDYPRYDFRGYRIFLPARKNVEKITQLLDFIAEYRCNTLVIELGGALEYKRHPEINSVWEEHCKDVGEYSGKGFKIANGEFFPWPKNVIHVDNGGGSFITQEQAKYIKKECDKRGIEIICEIPSLSHCDYLVKTYPEIRERIEDVQYPDSYCPSNPKTYEILFDVIDEAVEIFNPAYINIGHDELFSIGLCEKCKDKDPVDLFVWDVEKIHGYLKTKGIKTIMWADMLSGARPRHGGAGRSVKGDPQYVPALYTVRDRLPRDIIMIDWWVSYDPQLSYEIEKRGYNMLFGNLSAYFAEPWEQFECKNLQGGFLSNWGSLEPEYMQRNEQNFSLIYNSFVLWCGADKNKKEELAVKTLDIAYEKAKAQINKKYVELLVTTDYYTPSRAFYDGDFIIDSEFILGNLVITLKNKETRKLCLKYGQNIGNCDLNGETFKKDRCGFAMGALPVEIDGKCYYKTFWQTDFEVDDIEKIEFEKIMDKEFNVEYKFVEGHKC